MRHDKKAVTPPGKICEQMLEGMDILHSVRVSILLAFMALPLLLINFTAFLAIALGNMGLFILFVGQVVLIPIATELAHMVTEKGAASGRFHISGTDIAMLVPSASRSFQQNVAPSYWMVQTLFFLSYLMTNAITIHGLPAESSARDWQVSNRRSKTVAVMLVITLAIVFLPIMRYSLTGTETVAGILIAAVVGGGLGVAWYTLASACGVRHADVFGIVQQMSPNNGVPTACVYTPVA
jgi:hypothetical protein